MDPEASGRAAATACIPNSCRTHDSRRRPEVQADIRWTPPTGPLGRLIASAHERAARGQGRASEFRARVRDLPPAISFVTALSGGDVAVIAELKRRSPSRGDIHPSMIASVHAGA